jgi:hypothetical protein
MKFGFKIHLDDIAEKLIERGFSSRDIDSDDLTNAVVELLQDDYELFTALEEKMQTIEDGNHPEPRDVGEYLEKIGEV